MRYLRTLEADGGKPATLSRRIASLATVHRMLDLGGDAPPRSAPIVRNALRAQHRRQGAAQRQAAPMRFGGELGGAGGFTISVLLDACSVDVQSVRDAALLSLRCRPAGQRVYWYGTQVACRTALTGIAHTSPEAKDENAHSAVPISP